MIKNESCFEYFFITYLHPKSVHYSLIVKESLYISSSSSYFPTSPPLLPPTCRKKDASHPPVHPSFHIISPIPEAQALASDRELREGPSATACWPGKCDKITRNKLAKTKILPTRIHKLSLEFFSLGRMSIVHALSEVS